MKFLKQYGLLSIVFLTGASVLILEILATRILSPYFGTTIFTVSSVIGVVLAALSIGYYVGGNLADRYPEERVFYAIILYSGLMVFFLFLFNAAILPIWGYKLPIISGPLIVAFAMFFLPSLLLGTLSPFAIKLQSQKMPGKGIGAVAGEIFFWSTLGSIFGSLSAGFVLIPHFGIDRILLGVGGLLIMLGFFPLLKFGFHKASLFFVLIGVAAFIAILSTFAGHRQKNVNLLYYRDGIYSRIIIYDINIDGAWVRQLLQDRSLSAGMYLNSDKLVFDYSKYYILFKIFQPNIKRALVLGGGAYSIPKALLSALPNAEIEVAEVEPDLFVLGKKYFRVPENPRLKNYVRDGRRLLHDSNKKYDLIFGDAYYSLYSVPAHLATREFFQIARDRLNDNGMFIANFIGSLKKTKPSFIFSEMKTFKRVFPNSYFFAAVSPDTTETQNIIFAGYKSARKIDFSSRAITQSNEEIIRDLPSKIITAEKLDLDPYPILTDNYSPVEYFVGASLKN